jgi:ribosomal 50S subunit-associated protein YjgA (DUF615 family)
MSQDTDCWGNLLRAVEKFLAEYPWKDGFEIQELAAAAQKARAHNAP